jgi:hypothetical protein
MEHNFYQFQALTPATYSLTPGTHTAESSTFFRCVYLCVLDDSQNKPALFPSTS